MHLLSCIFFRILHGTVHVDGPDVHLEAPRISAPLRTVVDGPGNGAGGQDEGGSEHSKSSDKAKKKPATVAAKKQEKVKKVLSYVEYQRRANALVLLLRRKEEGMKQIELMQAFLAEKEAEGEIQNEEELIQEVGLMRALIHRLITKDHVLLVIEVREKKKMPRISYGPLQPAEHLDQQLLRASPNYSTEGQIADFRKAS